MNNSNYAILHLIHDKLTGKSRNVNPLINTSCFANIMYMMFAYISQAKIAMKTL